MSEARNSGHHNTYRMPAVWILVSFCGVGVLATIVVGYWGIGFCCC